MICEIQEQQLKRVLTLYQVQIEPTFRKKSN